ncbi:DUF1127 domain-containing protein [Pseudoxanthobacter sp.]|uniref:DUF1127 domain-containing protein n=1 Tax=Pseudoxanthobacter sp. TaxID=1925742 RepID=UPI002FE1FF2C
MFAPSRSFALSRSAALAVRGFKAAASAVAAFWVAMRNRRQAHALLSMDDQMLRDIGITRGDVHSVLSGPVHRDPTRRLTVLAVERRAAARATARQRLAAPDLLETFLEGRTSTRRGRSDCDNAV